MNIKIIGKNKETSLLFEKVSKSLEELGLISFINLEKIKNDEKLKKDLNIKKEPAFLLEEENIDFSDIIFEGFCPSDEEIKSIIISIIGGGKANSCSGDCNGCTSC